MSDLNPRDWDLVDLETFRKEYQVGRLRWERFNAKRREPMVSGLDRQGGEERKPEVEAEKPAPTPTSPSPWWRTSLGFLLVLVAALGVAFALGWVACTICAGIEVLQRGGYGR